MSGQYTTAVGSPEQLGGPEVAQKQQATVEIVIVIVTATIVEMAMMVPVGAVLSLI
jgi:hypothetical protein